MINTLTLHPAVVNRYQEQLNKKLLNTKHCLSNVLHRTIKQIPYANHTYNLQDLQHMPDIFSHFNRDQYGIIRLVYQYTITNKTSTLTLIRRKMTNKRVN